MSKGVGLEYAVLPPDRRLPRRDYVLLPLLILLTVAVLGLASEGLLRVAWAQQEQDTCLAQRGGVTGHRANCVSMMKTAEGPWAEYRYNECGYRNPEPCGPKPAGAVRVAVVGSSLSGGAFVSYADSFAGRAARELSRACGRPVEFQNLGGFGFAWGKIGTQVAPALALHPDAMVMAMMPFDLARPYQPAVDVPQPTSQAVSPVSLAGVQALVAGSRVVRVAQHYLFGDIDRYTNLYVRYGDKADFMRAPFSPAWSRRVADWEALLAPMAEQAHAAGVPFVLAFVPQRAQLELLGRADAGGLQPDLLTRALRDMARRHGIVFVDLSREWRGRADRNALYYRVDGHLTAHGHELLDAAVERTLRSGIVPALAHCGSPSGEATG